MSENTKRLCFGIDASQITVKTLLKKDMLELSMKAISDANPNVNGSWFTPEAMERALPTFKNKPILGYFGDGDFGSHNGILKKDNETELEFWDTLGSKGERILGVIRSEDSVEIKEIDGLHWITLTCVLWTQYCYRQVKRLLKDAIKAKKNGGPTKNISVEIEVTDSEVLENGVEKINNFNLLGITILGSRNGVPIQPGIEGAELSIVDIMGKDIYEKQSQALRMAYAKFEGKEIPDKEDFGMEMEEEKKAEESEVKKEDEAACPSEPVKENEEAGCDPQPTSMEGNVPAVEKCAEEVCPNCGKPMKDCICSKQGEPKKENESVADIENEESENKSKPDPVCDLAWLLIDLDDDVKRAKATLKYYEDDYDGKGKEYLLAFIRRIVGNLESLKEDAGEVLAKTMSGDFEPSEEETEFESSMSQECSFSKLYAKYTEEKKSCEEKDAKIKEMEESMSKCADYDALKEKVASFEKKEFLSNAKTLIETAGLEETVSAGFVKACEDGKYSSVDDLKKDVALAAFENRTQIKETFAAPVTTPEMPAPGKAETPEKKTNWDVLRDYVSGK